MAVGSRNLTVTFTPDDTATYGNQTALATINVTPAILTVTADDASQPYGADNPTFTFQYSGFVNSEGSAIVTTAPTCSSTANSKSSVGNYAITCLGGVAPNYTIKYVEGKLTVNPALLTITANDTTKTYGDTVTFTGTEFTTSGLVNSDAVSSVTLTSAGATATAAVAGSPYAITPSAAVGTGLTNYTMTYKDGKLTVNRRNATWTTNSNSKTYGYADPVPLTTGSGDFLAADGVTATYSRVAGETVLAGPYHITATLGPAAVLTNYTITNAGASFTINARPTTWTTNSNSKTYGYADPVPLTTGSGDFLAADGVTATYSRAAGETVLAGPYHITATLGPAAVLTNYTITNAGASFTINAAPLSVTPADANRLYGSANPGFTATIVGIKNGDPITASYGTTATQSSNVGSYDITATLSDPANKLSNYTVTLNKGTLTINPAPLTIKADGKSKFLNAANPPLIATYSGFVLGQDPSALSGTLSCTTTATTNSSVGSYPINCSGQTSTNYAITYVLGTLSITYVTGGMCAGDVGHQIRQPINADGSSVWKQGATVPAKFAVCDANGVSIGTPGVVTSFNLISIVHGTTTNVDESPASTTPDTAFRWDPTGQQWIFNISTKSAPVNLANQTYIFQILLTDGSTINFQFGLK